MKGCLLRLRTYRGEVSKNKMIGNTTEEAVDLRKETNERHKRYRLRRRRMMEYDIFLTIFLVNTPYFTYLPQAGRALEAAIPEYSFTFWPKVSWSAVEAMRWCLFEIDRTVIYKVDQHQGYAPERPTGRQAGYLWVLA